MYIQRFMQRDIGYEIPIVKIRKMKRKLGESCFQIRLFLYYVVVAIFEETA